MPDYRLYRLGRNGRIISPPADLRAANDDDAMADARPILKGREVGELWEAGRLVGQVQGSDAGGVLRLASRLLPHVGRSPTS